MLKGAGCLSKKDFKVDKVIKVIKVIKVTKVVES